MYLSWYGFWGFLMMSMPLALPAMKVAVESLETILSSLTMRENLSRATMTLGSESPLLFGSSPVTWHALFTTAMLVSNFSPQASASAFFPASYSLAAACASSAACAALRWASHDMSASACAGVRPFSWANALNCLACASFHSNPSGRSEGLVG